MGLSLVSVLHFVWRTGQRFKFNLLPNHFYSDTPDLRHLRSTTYWRQRYDTSLVNGGDVDQQLARLKQVVADQAGRFTDDSVWQQAGKENGEIGYGPIEAVTLYCDILHHRPARIVQVGCGVSTALILRAAQEAGYTPQITCVEPYPTDYLRRLSAEGKIRLIPEIAQTVDRSVFTQLMANDLLFIDSTHTVKVGSEVVRIITDVLPRLTAGVRVHFHDITWPYDYGSGILDNAIFFWRESTLLWTFLINNSKYRIDYSMWMLHVDRVDEVKKLFPCYNPRVMSDGLERSPDGHVPSSVFLVAQ